MKPKITKAVDIHAFLNHLDQYFTDESLQAAFQGTPKFRLRQVPPDGTCQFHAVYDQLIQLQQKHGSIFPTIGKSITNGDQLRGEVVRWLRNNRKEITPFFLGNENLDVYFDTMENGAWGDNLTLYAMSKMFDVQINVIGYIQNETISPQSVVVINKNANHIINVLHRYENHYDSLLLVDT